MEFIVKKQIKQNSKINLLDRKKDNLMDILLKENKKNTYGLSRTRTDFINAPQIIKSL